MRCKIFIPQIEHEKTVNQDDYLVNQFGDLGNQKLVENLQTILNWHTPTRIQMASMKLLLSGENLVATAQTGSGKTGAFMVPLVLKESC